MVAFGWLFHKTYATLCAIKRKKVAYGTYSHWKSYIARLTLTLYEVFDANFLDSRVCNKCSLSVPLDSSNSVEKLCGEWVLSASVCGTGSFSAHTVTHSISENAHETQSFSTELRNPKNLTNNLPFRYNSKGNEREE